MSKALVFISHTGAERDVALAFKELIEAKFLGMIEVFVSSDDESLPMGGRWLDDITDALRRCAVEVVVCSKVSIVRPWVNFEAGAGWVRDIPVIPLCHSGMVPGALPNPLRMLQAANATSAEDMWKVFKTLAKALECTPPPEDFAGFIAKVSAFETKYTFWDAVNGALEKLNAIEGRLLPALANASSGASLQVQDYNYDEFRKACVTLSTHNIITFRQSGAGMSTAGSFKEFELSRGTDWGRVMRDPSCKHRS